MNEVKEVPFEFLINTNNFSNENTFLGTKKNKFKTKNQIQLKLEFENISRKDLFLKNLKSKNGYKRYTGTPLRYAGGKTLAVGKIIEHIPDNIQRLVSPFIGGGSVEVAVAKELGIEVIAYDIFELLVNYWNFQINNPVGLYEKLKTLKNTKIEYENIKNILKSIWSKENGLMQNNLTDLEMAAYYFFNHNLSYGPGFLGWMSNIYTNEKKYKSMIEKVKNFDIKNMKVFNLSFEKSIPKHSNDFLYLDPPYFLDGDSKMFKGIYPMRNFPIHHNNFNHNLLAELLKDHKGGFVLSYNDCSWVRETYKDFEIIEISWQYTMGQGETRIGKNRLNRNYDNSNIKTSHELIIKG
ncbi:MAG: DNA methyltransferase [Candidatus Sericytochromatia bacterium]|nr:MAG: DNA methyltransferase [Candidatus Sericytochromatia bacterium]